MKPLSPLVSQEFTDRVKRVQAEVIARTASTPTNERNGHRARLWCAWIQKNACGEPAATTSKSSIYKIDRDFSSWGAKS